MIFNKFLLDEKDILFWEILKRVLEIILGLSLNVLIINFIWNCFKMLIGWYNVVYIYKRNILNNI